MQSGALAMLWTWDLLLDRIDAIGQRIPLTAALPLAGLYLMSVALWASGFKPHPEFILVFAPAWTPALLAVYRNRQS